MSDEGQQKKTDAGPFVHYCDHDGCGKWGSFGFDMGGGVTRWACMEHQPADYKGFKPFGSRR